MVLTIQNLSKRYGAKEVLKSINFTVELGDIVYDRENPEVMGVVIDLTMAEVTIEDDGDGTSDPETTTKTFPRRRAVVEEKN